MEQNDFCPGACWAALLLSMSGCQQGNTTSSAVSSQAVSSAAASSEETTEGPVETYHDMPVQTLDLDPSDPDYYQKALETELYNYKLIRNVPTAYQAESWDAYTATANTLLNIDPDNIDDVSKSMIDNAVAQREALVQDAPAATVCGTSGGMHRPQPRRWRCPTLPPRAMTTPI